MTGASSAHGSSHPTVALSSLLSVLTVTLREISTRARTFGKCGVFMAEATSRLSDACRLNPSGGGGGGGKSTGGGGRSGDPGEEACAGGDRGTTSRPA